jgi:poly-gamma-glutamate capsule biosynthesis protein CapA/YwtB (metallophosphatase superfamily)
MGRLLALGVAIAALAGAAVAVWLLAVDPGEDGAASPRPRAERDELPRPPPKARPERRRFTVAATGDLLMHQPLLDRARRNGGGDEYDFAPFFREVRPYLAKRADLALCHVETPMGPGPPATYPVFNTPTDLARSITESGWDACSTASNHSLDQGMAGIAGTSEALDKRGIAHTGTFASKRAAGRPTILRVAGVKIGFVSYTDATNGFRAPTDWALNEYAAAAPKAGAKAIIADARDARDAGADAVIVNVHWGTEYASRPNASQRAVAKRLTDAKVIAAVVGQHPHVVEPIERVNGKFVVFSEGNLVSNQSAAAGLPAQTQDGLIALLRLEATGGKVRVLRVKYLPTWVRPGDFTVLPAHPSADRRYAAELRASRARTIGVVGEHHGVEPVGGG